MNIMQNDHIMRDDGERNNAALGISHAVQPSVNEVWSAEILIDSRAGFHARPASVLAIAAKKFQSTIRLIRDDDEGNAKSVVSLIALGLEYGDVVRLVAVGSDAAEAIRTLTRLVQHCDETNDNEDWRLPATSKPRTAHTADRPEYGSSLVGIGVSAGLSCGAVVQFRSSAVDESFPDEQQPKSRDGEIASLWHGIDEARREIEFLKSRKVNHCFEQMVELQLELVSDQDLINYACREIDRGCSALEAWRSAYRSHAQRIDALESPSARERAQDIRDIGSRVTRILANRKFEPYRQLENSILIADELMPSDFLALIGSGAKGFCSCVGGATSHIAILARSLGLPAICGIDARALKIENGRMVVIDGKTGVLNASPSEHDLAQARSREARLKTDAGQLPDNTDEAARTLDGQTIRIAANICNLNEAQEARRMAVEGIGLLRTELLFADRTEAPSESEQALEYAGLVAVLGRGRPLVVRTLDVGGDKTVPYISLPDEENPSLGMRGIRASLDQPALFRTQIRAILRAASDADVRIMLPMVSTVEELRETKRIIAEEQNDIACDVQLGAMIEVPSAALMAEHFAREVDFLSIGTNDLCQYALAIDRNHPKLSCAADPLHPAVLQLIAATVRGAARAGCDVTVCGCLASEPLAIPALLGLGVKSLSVDLPAIGSVKAAIRHLDFHACKRLAEELLTMSTASDVRSRIAEFIDFPPCP